jgi:hypothetical protein
MQLWFNQIRSNQKKLPQVRVTDLLLLSQLGQESERAWLEAWRNSELCFRRAPSPRFLAPFKTSHPSIIKKYATGILSI